MRPKKTDIVRRRTGCQRCRSKRRQCDETRPECLACVRRGVPCSGYENRIRFKDVSDQTAEASKRVEAARWSALRSEDSARLLHAGRTGAGTTSLFSEEPTNPLSSSPGRPPNDEALIPDVHLLDRLFDADANPPTTAAEEDDDGYNAVFAPSAPPGHSGFVTGVLSATDLLWPFQARPMSEVQNMLVAWNDPQLQQQPSPSPWEDFVNYPEPSRAPTPAPRTPRAPDQGTIATSQACLATDLMTEEALLAIFTTDIAPHIGLELPYARLCTASSGFRAAVLSLAVAAHSSRSSSSKPKVGCHYYDFAVADLSHQLRRPRQDVGDALLGTVILLIHRELVAGSHLGIRARLRQLEEMTQVMDISSHCSPSLLRAWRMLSFEMRLCSLPTRKTITGPPPPHTTTPWDTQMTIRDIFSSLWRLHCRAVIEASFPEGAAPAVSGSDSAPSASRKAAQWLCMVLGRTCDRRNWEQQDHHDQSLSGDAIMGQIATFEERLDMWHRSIGRDELPVPCLDRGAGDILSLPLGGTIVPYDVPGPGKAIDYALYLLSRMICMYLAASFGRREALPPASRDSAAKAEAMARIVLGIMLKREASPSRALSEPETSMLALIAAQLTEGGSIATAVHEGVLPVLRNRATSAAERATDKVVEQRIELIIRERHAGRSIRCVISGFEEEERVDAVLDVGQTKHAIFGDMGGRGFFRDVVTTGAYGR
ncbi:hypothetical protein F5X68DRAFT_260360 [Plectosphaerella plurivora]|uniref:Zn(2)-C6 fungal-type domain-containing protein n=1 Tax=Plectosphaerella plurivora TaxID=936078 RepID=A0A9P8VF73_9PEZI|nr:hypothetical protein F5X68DRAFT_260360 [Plectosphaerella plurivora]